MSFPLVIPTERDPVLLRQLTIEHAPAYFEAVDANRDHLSQFGDTTASKYQTLESVEDSIVNPSNPHKLRMGVWDGNDFVGSANLTPKEHNTAEIGYWLDGRKTGNGYATLATRALAGYARQNRYYRVFAHVTDGNNASAAVLMRAGFVQRVQIADTLVFVLANRVHDANYESSFVLESITSREQFITAESVREFRNKYASDVTSQRADRAFGLLINPDRGNANSLGREHFTAEDLGLIVKTRQELGLPMPSKDAIVSNVDVVQVGSLLDFIEERMANVSVWGLNGDTRQFLSRLAEHLKLQLADTK